MNTTTKTTINATINATIETTIENGVTIISTGKSGGEIINKTGVRGITIYKGMGSDNRNKYRSEIQVGKRKYAVGFFDTMEEAVKARDIAEEKRQDGTLIEWLKEKPHGNSSRFAGYWAAQFEEYEKNKTQNA